MLYSLLCLANSPSDSVKLRYDPLYIKKYPKYLALTPVMMFRAFTLGFSNGREREITVEYSPNLVPQYGLDIDYNWFSIGIVSSWGLNQEVEEKGKTFTLGIGGSLTRPKWIAFGNLNYYKGLYISNSKELEPLSQTVTEIYPQRKDLGVLNGRGTALFVFNNKKYSHASALSITTERQAKSAGSFLLGATITFYNIWSDSSLIPKALAEYFDSTNFVRGSDYFLFLGNVGYSYTAVVKKKWFANGGLQFGLGPVYSHIRRLNNVKSTSRLDAGATVELRFGIGFNGDRLFGGFLTHIISTSSTAGDVASINNSSYTLRFFVGYRFPIKFKVPILG